jgi:hypothetical protein
LAVLDHWRFVCDLGPRPAGTAAERAAAAALRDRLAGLGLAVREEEFPAPGSYTWELLTICGLVLAGLAIAGASPLAGFGLCAGGAWLFHRHFNLLPSPTGSLFARRKSRNVVGETGPAAGRPIVIMAHYDTALPSLLFSPAQVKGFRRSYLIGAAVVLSAPLVAIAGPLGPAATILRGLWAVVLLVNAATLIHRELAFRPVVGANDNASGVGVALEIAERFAREPLPGVRLVVALTGAEETGAWGARRLVKGVLRDLEHPLVLNVDNVGSGHLRVLRAEGMLGLIRYPPGVVDAALMATGLASGQDYPLAFTDALPVARAGYACATLLAMSADGQIPNWHWPSDVPANVEPAALERAANAAWQTVRRSGQA